MRELTQRAASTPNRAENLAQPVCGFVGHLDDRGADPQAGAGAAGCRRRDRSRRSADRPRAATARDRRRRRRARRATHITFSSASGSASPSGVLAVAAFDVVVADQPSSRARVRRRRAPAARRPPGGRRRVRPFPRSRGAPMHIVDERFEVLRWWQARRSVSRCRRSRRPRTDFGVPNRFVDSYGSQRPRPSGRPSAPTAQSRLITPRRPATTVR